VLRRINETEDGFDWAREGVMKRRIGRRLRVRHAEKQCMSQKTNRYIFEDAAMPDKDKMQQYNDSSFSSFL